MALWRAKQCWIRIAEAITTIGTTATLKDQQLTPVDWSGRTKSVELSGCEADIETVFLFGTDVEGRQNADISETATTMREFSGTLVYQDIDTGELMTAPAVTLGGSASDFQRIEADTTRTKKSVLVELDDGLNKVHILMNNCYVTKIGDISLDAEGHAEQEISVKCLAKDYYEEDNI